jgi:hypothetical protein
VAQITVVKLELAATARCELVPVVPDADLEMS